MTEGTSISRGVVGSLRPGGATGAVRMEDRFATSPEDLWSALTDPRRLASWLGDVEGELRSGGAFTARFTSGWEGPGRVDVCEPPARLLVTSGEGDDITEMAAWLTPDGDGTVLVIEERGLPVAALAGHGAGWQAHVEDLAAHLAGRPTSDWATRWRELRPEYEERASTR